MFARSSDGKVFVWGQNEFGQLGIGYINDGVHPLYPEIMKIE